MRLKRRRSRGRGILICESHLPNVTLHSSRVPSLAGPSTDRLQDDGQHFRGYSSVGSLSAVTVDADATPAMTWLSTLFIDQPVSSSIRSFR